MQTVELVMFNYKIGNDNRATGAQLGNEYYPDPSLNFGIRRINSTGLLTMLAQYRQRAMTKSPEKAAHYTDNQSKIRTGILAKLLGLEGLSTIIRETPKLTSPDHARALILGNELPILPIIKDLSKLLPYFTHIFLAVADVAPKPSALELVIKSQDSALPIVPIIFAKDTSKMLTKLSLTHLLTAPILPPRSRTVEKNKKTINVIRESGTGIDKASYQRLHSIMSRSSHPLHIMHSDLSINSSNPLSLTDSYRPLSNHLHIVGTHASEMVGVLSINPPEEIHIVTRRGRQEEDNANWLMKHYDRFYLSDDIRSGSDMIYLRKNESTVEALAAAVGTVPAIEAIISFLNTY
jgi:hypothetical protein